MTVEFFTALAVFLVLLLMGSIALSAYLIYDMVSGNYRRFLLANEERED